MKPSECSNNCHCVGCKNFDLGIDNPCSVCLCQDCKHKGDAALCAKCNELINDSYYEKED